MSKRYKANRRSRYYQKRNRRIFQGIAEVIRNSPELQSRIFFKVVEHLKSFCRIPISVNEEGE